MLQKITFKILSVFVMGFIPHNVLANIIAESKIQKFDFKMCTREAKCVHIYANSAESSQFIPLYILKKIKVEIQNKKVIESEFGYLNFSQNILVLDLKNGAEYTLDLQTLEEKNFTK